MKGTYVDKSMFFKEWFESGDEVTLITRPRRFGKSTNLNLLRDFFDLASNINEPLFKKQEIFIKHEKFCKDHYRKYSVILLDFKCVKGHSFNQMKNRLLDVMKENFFNLVKNYELECDLVQFVNEEFKNNQEFIFYIQ